VIETSRLLPYLVTEFGLFMAPGPSVVFVVSRGVAFGRLAALIAVAGNTLGLISQLLVVVVILGGAFAHASAVPEVLKLAGAAWLIYLGIRTLADRRADDRDVLIAEARAGARGRLLRQGWVVGLTNPKGIVTFTAIAPQLIHRSGHIAVAPLAALGALAVLVAMICDGAWGLVAGNARAWLGRSERRRARLNVGGGLLMVAFGIGLAIITLA
jgi:threonine/homoserine/homoserine lactone efflux protein